MPVPVQPILESISSALNSGFVAFQSFAQTMNTLFIAGIGIGATAATGVAIADRMQKKDVLKHNFPLLGRLIPLVDWGGKFWRNHGGAMDREELPFNRAQRDSVKRLAEKKSDIVPFGSTRNLSLPGTPIFVNAQFPPLASEVTDPAPLRIGPYCRTPFDAKSIFNISAMSYGALSKPAVQALSKGAKLANCWMNTGEGGLAPAHLEGGCDIVFQIGTAKYGVRDEQGRFSPEKLKEVAAHDEVKMIEVKLAQGAKPGKGGILPGIKVTKEIAGIRGIPEGKDSISPNRHEEISSNAELLDFISNAREITGKPVGFKTVFSSRTDMEALCEEIVKRGIKSAPDFITLDSGDGGSGAAPLVLIDNAGLTLEESLPMLSETLIKYGLKDRIRTITSGKLVTAADVAWALCAGADFVNSARGFMFALGCVQALRCDKNTCPTGITTSNPKLQKGLNPADKATKVANFCLGLIDEVEILAHSCGVKEPRQLRPNHVRLVQNDGNSVPMSQLHPALKF